MVKHKYWILRTYPKRGVGDDVTEEEFKSWKAARLQQRKNIDKDHYTTIQCYEGR